jgi:hypothetical protein
VRALSRVKYIIKSTAMTGLSGVLTPVSRPVHGEHNVAKRHPLDIRRRHSTNHEMQIEQSDMGANVALNAIELEDIAAALPLAAARLRSNAGEVPRMEQRRQLCEQADRFDWMRTEMQMAVGEDLGDLASSQRFDFLRRVSNDNQLPEEE